MKLELQETGNNVCKCACFENAAQKELEKKRKKPARKTKDVKCTQLTREEKKEKERLQQKTAGEKGRDTESWTI